MCCVYKPLINTIYHENISFLFNVLILSSLESGYLTGYSFDWPSFGTWQFRLMGFDNPPTDFYPRPFNMIAERLLKYPDMCLASKTISKVQFDYIRQIFDKFRNQLKFFLTHNGKIIFLLIVHLLYCMQIRRPFLSKQTMHICS